jgi:REP element-mobilizing transposase RayT
MQFVPYRMPTKRVIPYSEGIYFITFTCYQWMHLFKETSSYDEVYKWFDYLKSKGHYIVGYVIMPNHLHALIAFRRSDQSINTIIGNGKRFMAYEIIKRLEKQGKTALLKRMKEGVNDADLLRKKQHAVWEYSFDWKECTSDAFINQKLNYMHVNPCKGTWNLASSPADYEHSSARFYISGEHSAYAVMNAGELADIDLTKKIS